MSLIVLVFAFAINTIPCLPLVKKQRECRGAKVRLALVNSLAAVAARDCSLRHVRLLPLSISISNCSESK